VCVVKRSDNVSSVSKSRLFVTLLYPDDCYNGLVERDATWHISIRLTFYGHWN